MKEKHKCEGKNKPKGMVGILRRYSFPHADDCAYNGTLFEKEKWYCKHHAPSKIAERKRKSEETMWRNVAKARKVREEYLKKRALENGS